MGRIGFPAEAGTGRNGSYPGIGYEVFLYRFLYRQRGDRPPRVLLHHGRSWYDHLPSAAAAHLQWNEGRVDF